jgi:putative ABC transport system substrate-binding protein
MGVDRRRLTVLLNLGANVTGVTFFTAQLLQKQLALLRELVPTAAVISILINPDNPRAQADVNSVQEAARSLALDTYVVNAGTQRDLDTAFASLVRRRADALLIAGDPFLLRSRTEIAALAARHAIPAIFATREFAEAGGLMTYGASLHDAFRKAGVYKAASLTARSPLTCR